MIWNSAISKLRKMGLILEEDNNTADTLDTHPFVREYFAKQFQKKYPRAWQKGHKRLYEYYSRVAAPDPDTTEKMLDLFKAIAHGCKAGLHGTVLEQVYQRRIMKGNEYFSTNKLGAISSELVALSGFFDRPWTTPVRNLSKKSKGYVLKEAGFHLLALGRPEEAVKPTEQALKIWENLGDQQNTIRAASKLSELYLTLGHLNDAQNYAKRSAELADQKVTFQQMAKANLAAALHQLGDFDEAKNLLLEVAKMQKESEPKSPLLYSWQGFRYYDLLLDIGEREKSLEKFQEVQKYANKALGWAKQKDRLFDIALNSLVLGRALLLIELKTENIGNFNLTEAELHLDEAVKKLRNANRHDYLPYSLIIRSILYRKAKHLDKSENDLNEALEIAVSGRMKIYQADAHLEFVSLHLDKHESDKARKSLKKAKDLINQMNYQRQNWRVKSLEEILSKNQKKTLTDHLQWLLNFLVMLTKKALYAVAITISPRRNY